MTDLQTMADFAAKHGVTMYVERVEPTEAEAKDWPKGASHWRCVLACGGRKSQIRFHQGSGLKDEPTVADLLNCIALDAVEPGLTFEDWCDEYGYDSDSRKAERTFEACRKQTESARLMLGDEAFEELLSETERD